MDAEGFVGARPVRRGGARGCRAPPLLRPPRRAQGGAPPALPPLASPSALLSPSALAGSLAGLLPRVSVPSPFGAPPARPPKTVHEANFDSLVGALAAAKASPLLGEERSVSPPLSPDRGPVQAKAGPGGAGVASTSDVDGRATVLSTEEVDTALLECRTAHCPLPRTAAVGHCGAGGDVLFHLNASAASSTHRSGAERSVAALGDRLLARVPPRELAAWRRSLAQTRSRENRGCSVTVHDEIKAFRREGGAYARWEAERRRRADEARWRKQRDVHRTFRWIVQRREGERKWHSRMHSNAEREAAALTIQRSFKRLRSFQPPDGDAAESDRQSEGEAEGDEGASLRSGLESRASPTTLRRSEEEASARAAEIAALRAQANAVARRLDRNRRDLERETQAIVERDHLGFRSRSSSWTSSVTRERAGRRGYKV